MQSGSQDSVSNIQWFAVDFEADFEIPLQLDEKISEAELLSRIKPSRLYAWSRERIEDSDAQYRFRSEIYVEVCVPSQIFSSDRKKIGRHQDGWIENYFIDKFYIAAFQITTVDDFADEHKGRIARIGRLRGKGLLRERSYVPATLANSATIRADFPSNDSDHTQVSAQEKKPSAILSEGNLGKRTLDFQAQQPSSLVGKGNAGATDLFNRAASPREPDIDIEPTVPKPNGISKASSGFAADRASKASEEDSERLDTASETRILQPNGSQTVCIFCKWYVVIIVASVIYLEIGSLSAIAYVFTQVVICHYRLITRNENQSGFASNVLGLCWALLLLISLQLGISSLCMIQSREMLVSMLVVLSIVTAIFAKDRLFCSVQPVLIFLVISVISNAALLCSHSAVRGQASVDAIPSPDEGRNALGAENRIPQADTKPLVQESKREPFFGNLTASFKNRLFKTDDVSELELVRMQRLTGDTTYPLHVLSELEGWFPSHRLCTDKLRDAELIYLGAAAAFDRDSPDLSASARTTIKRVGKLLARVDFSELLIIGHADNLGNSIYNYELSKKRALAFYEALIRETSLPPEKMRALGRGDTSPIFSPSTALSSYNRRVELLIICEHRK